MTLQAKLDAFKADFEAGKPPYSVSRSVIDTMHRAMEELIASGAAARAQGRRHRTALRAEGSGQQAGLGSGASGPRAAGRLGRLARPEEIAAAMLFLASEDSSFVAGSELLVDGGMCSV
jgi:NAD(P)-dependent dehydrogenase (short-subunit alcohol dehydrogenase family)